MTAGYRHLFVRANVGDEEQRALEALFDLSHPAEIDQEPAVDPQEAFGLQLLLKIVEALSGGLHPPLVADATAWAAGKRVAAARHLAARP